MDFKILHPDKQNRKQEILNFFIENKTKSYISHSEILSGRAQSIKEWSANLEQILSDELDDEGTIAITIESENKVIGLGLVRIVKKNLIIEDLIIDENLRGFSLGKKMMDYIVEYSKQKNIENLFLESGISNDGAHHFFEKQGFKKISVSYILELN